MKGAAYNSLKALLLSCIDEEITGTEQEKLAKVREIFESEMLWDKDKINYQGRLKRVQDWLQGLCGTVSIPFYNSDIIKLYENWLGREAKNDNESIKWVEKYWLQTASTLHELMYK